MTAAARVRVQRRIAAEPLSVALLLTAQSALDLWPGLRLARRRGPDLLVSLAHRGRQHELALSVLPPRRNVTGFVLDFHVTGGEFATTTGTLLLAASPAGTQATLDIHSPVEALAAPARAFMARLAAQAESRSAAA